MEVTPGGREALDLERPSAARMYDFFLGGAHNFSADREAASRILEIYPDAAFAAQANRGFLRRAVTELLGRGVRQFIDLGSGIPTAGNVHEIAEGLAPGTRVLYVDSDPVAVAHSEAILAGRLDVAVLEADVRRPEQILGSAALRELIDLDQPVAVLAVAVLHFVDDEGDPAGILSAFRDAVAAGSYLALSHGTIDRQPDNAARSERVYQNTRDPLSLRTRAEISGLLRGWDLLAPGLVWLPEWRPDWSDEATEDPSRTEILCAVGQKV